MSKRPSRGATGSKFRAARGIPVGALINCADNTGAVNLYVISVFGYQGRLNRYPAATCGDCFLCTVKKGKPEQRKKVTPGVLIRQRKMWRRKNGMHICFEDNSGCILTPTGEIKGTSISGPVATEVAQLFPKISSRAEALA